MLHQPIFEEDPDVAQAVKDFTPVVVELRQRNEAFAKLPDHSPHRPAAQALISELNSRIALRAERLDMTSEQLVEQITLSLDLKARRGRAAPTDRETSRTLVAKVTQAQARERDAHLALSAAQSEVKAATAARVAADRAYAAYAARGAR